MPIIKGLEWTFDTVAVQYEKLRPAYVAEVYEDIFRYKQLDQTSRAMEVGIGGGQATLPILKTGCKVTAVEYGENFSQLCHRKFREFSGFSVVTDVSTERSKLGAIQNRLEHTINNLDNIIENTTSAESSIRDTDIATEMVRYANNNILAQAGQSMLAQANQSNQGVLSLLQ